MIPELLSTYITMLEEYSETYESKRVMSREEAHKYLKDITEEDFGYDTEAWRNYFLQYDFDSIEGIETALKGQIKRAKKWKKNQNKNIE